MINFDDYANENKTNHNLKWWLRIWKANALLNLINNKPDIGKTYLYAKDPYEAKYQFLLNKKESTGLNHFNDPKAITEYSNDIHDVYKNINSFSINSY